MKNRDGYAMTPTFDRKPRVINSPEDDNHNFDYQTTQGKSGKHDLNAKFEKSHKKMFDELTED